jgi:hypothetical protein
VSATAARNIAVAREYLQALERFATGEELARYFTPDVVQQEFPNRLSPQGAQRGLAEMLAGAERGKQMLKRQTLAVKNTVADGNLVALEFEWIGVLAQPIGHLAAGDAMRAHIAAFLEFSEDGRIKTQRNYDCYQPL